MTRRWLFADQRGPQFVDTPDQPVLLVESRRVFARRRFHRAKAHLLLSALRHRAAELGGQAVFLQVDSYDEALNQLGEQVTVVQPTSYAADGFVRARGIEVVSCEGAFATSREEFAEWAAGRKRLLLEDFYRWQRQRNDLLMDGEDPAGGKWNYDHDNREPPLAHFVEHRLAAFGPHEDAMLAQDPWMAHSALSPALNLGLLHPLECVCAAQQPYRVGAAPLASVEGYSRQVVGWREYIWSIYWHVPRDYRQRNAMPADQDLPEWFRSLNAAGEVTAHCLRSVLADVRERGWVHHIPRLIVLSNYALQRGWRPEQVTAWFHEAFVDGYDWVMLPNVVGMSQHADGGLIATRPYVSGGAFINPRSDYCGACAYDPKARVGPTACQFTAGYWGFLDRNADRLRGNRRMLQPLAGLGRLKDLPAVLEQDGARGSDPP